MRSIDFPKKVTIKGVPGVWRVKIDTSEMINGELTATRVVLTLQREK